MDKDYRENTFKFGDLFLGIGSFIDLLSEMVKEDKDSIAREGNLGPSNEKGLKGSYNYSIKLGLSETDNLKPLVNNRIITGKKPERIFDIFDEGAYFLIIIEIQGVTKEDLVVLLENNNVLIVQSQRSAKPFFKEIPLPENVQDDKITWSFKNNILEARLWKV